MFKFLLVNLIFAEARLSSGQCDEIEYISDFKPKDFAGHWYEIVRDSSNAHTISTDCVTKEFSVNKDGDLDLYFRGHYKFYGDYMGVNGTMY